MITLQAARVNIQMLQGSPLGTLSTLLHDPNVIFLLFVVALIGILMEISHPGAIVPGVAGVIALLLFLFAASSLDPNWMGSALMVLAFVLLVLDVKLPAHGMLTIGAVISLVIGSLLFFNSGGVHSGPQLDPLVVYIMAGVVGLIGFTLVTFIARAQRQRVTTGVEGMIGATAIALTPLTPEGRVRYGGEDWAAMLNGPAASVDAGTELEVVSVDGLRLHVLPKSSYYQRNTGSVSLLQ